jgi:chloramphenicol 3-O phosphotransferase
MVERGRAIILNGGSSAGKTSLGKELQKQLAEPYLLMGIDLFWFTMPEKQLNLQTVDPEYYSWVEEQDSGLPYFRIVPGPILDKMMLARYRAMAAYLDYGLNLIADEVIWKRDWLEEGLRVLEPYTVWFVGVYCDDRTLGHREVIRGDRTAGWGRGSQLYTHRDAEYDIVVDTSVTGPPEHARKIAAAVTSGDRPTACDRMRSKLGIA